MLTLDASTVISSFLDDEPEHDVCARLFGEIVRRRIPIISPTLLLTELAASLGRRSGDPIQAIANTETFIGLQHFTWIPVDVVLALASARAATPFRLRGADAIYVAVAVQHQTTLVSLDKEHLTRVSAPPVVVTPTDALAMLGNSPATP